MSQAVVSRGRNSLSTEHEADRIRTVGVIALAPSALAGSDARRRLRVGARVGGRHLPADDGRRDWRRRAPDRTTTARRSPRRPTRSRSIRDELAAAIDADAAAYDRVVAAYKLPKGTADEQQARKVGHSGPRFAAATGRSASVDAAVGAARCDEAETIAAHGHRAAASDVGTAMTLLRAGLHGAGLNVEINLGACSDPSYVQHYPRARRRGSRSRRRGATQGSGRGRFEPASASVGQASRQRSRCRRDQLNVQCVAGSPGRVRPDAM